MESVKMGNVGYSKDFQLSLTLKKKTCSKIKHAAMWGNIKKKIPSLITNNYKS